MLDQIRGLYFSGHHLTRDLIGNVAPLTAFAALLVAFVGPAQVIADNIFKNYLVSASVWTFILALVVYLAGGYFIGSVVAFTANFMQRLVSYLPYKGEEYSYTFWYKKDATDIDALYNKLFPEYQYLSSGSAVTPTDKINVLKEYFRKFNPEGYSETYRQFMKVDVARAAMFYSLAFLVYQFCAWIAVWPAGGARVYVFPSVICALVLLMAFLELPRRIRKVVRTEYQFIIATARIRDDINAAAARAARPAE